MNDNPLASNAPAEALPLLESLRGLIAQARQKVARAAGTVQVQTYWEIGRHLVEFEQGGATRAAYGTALLATLADALTREFGKGFDASNLRYMRLFYQTFPIRDALRHEWGWTHYRLLFRVDAPDARRWYLEEAAAQNWSTRTLERQMATLSYELVLPTGRPGRTPVVRRNRSGRRQPIMNGTDQKLIAASLSSLDEQIASQARKIEGLKRHKKGLMQQLFPSAGEVDHGR